MEASSSSNSLNKTLALLVEDINHDDATSLNNNLSSASIHATVISGQTDDVTLLMLAAGKGSTSCMQALIKAGCNVNAIDSDGDTAMFYASGSGCPEAIDILMRYGARINAQSRDGRTPLMGAAYMQDANMTAHMFNRGALVDIRDNHGRSALYYVTRGPMVPNVEVIRLLLSSNANPRELYENHCALTVSSRSGFLPTLVPLSHIRKVLNRTDLGVMRLNPDTFYPGSPSYDALFL